MQKQIKPAKKSANLTSDRIAFIERLNFCVDKVGSVAALARASGISAPTIADYMAGSDPSRERVVAMARAASVSFLWLGVGEGTPDGKPAPLQESDIIRNMAESLPDRMKWVVKEMGGVMPISLTTRIDDKLIDAFMAGKEEPTIEQLNLIAQVANLDAGWLISGKGSMERIQGMNMPQPRAVERAAIAQEPVSEDSFRLPVMNVEASAGDGAAVIKEEVAEYMSLSRSVVRSLGLTRGEAFVVYARGESMEPVIKGGELLVCSSAERHLKAGDGIYLLRLEGEILVKHLQRLPRNKVRVFSENPRYEPFEVTINDGIDFRILGKVLHALRQV
ncbi:MAG: S24 family peptidase [Alphaproteobacteria bacterium]|nr:S24 family peptidase [Alphaproteobacteria bacterium]